MSLQVLADLSGLSPSFLSRVENGLRSLDRRSHQAAVAEALRVSLGELTGAPYDVHDPHLASVHAVIPPLRLALLDFDLDDPVHDPVRPLDEIAADVRALEAASERYDYKAMAEALPRLFAELHAAASAGENPTAALRLVNSVCHVAHAVTMNLGYHDLTWLVVDRQYASALRLGDRVVIGAAQHSRVVCLTSAGATRRAIRLGERALSEMSGGSLPARQLLSTATALAAAVARDGDAASGFLREAQDMAARTGGGRLTSAGGLVYGPANVALEQLGVALELGDIDSAVAATRADVSGLPQRRLVQWHMACGRAFAESGQAEAAVAAFVAAERVAPLKLRADPRVKDAVVALRNRAAGPALAGLAYRLGIPA